MRRAKRRPQVIQVFRLSEGPHVLAEELADDLRSALAQMEDVLGDLQMRAEGKSSS